MSLINLFTKKAPTFDNVGAGGAFQFEFDAVLEDTLEVSAEITGYTIESGARLSDHRVINPIRYTLTGAVSNNPLRAYATDFLSGAVSNVIDGSIAAAGSGLFAGFLAGSDESRSSATLEFLVWLAQSGEPFTIDAGDITLKNMALISVNRTKDATNEGGLIFVAELQEVITLDRLITAGSAAMPTSSQLKAGSLEASAVSRTIESGQKMAKEASKSVADKVSAVLDSITE